LRGEGECVITGEEAARYPWRDRPWSWSLADLSSE
jgi:hypothetical protein